MPNLTVLVASTRPGRVGSTVGQWFAQVAKNHGGFEVQLVELADMNLPVFNEPEHPAKQAYVYDHTKEWSKKVAESDAFVFVTPEYNFSTPPSLLNALTYLVKEWHYKAAGFVSYGGISGGLRSVQMTKQILTTFKVFPITEAVVLPNVFSFLDDEGTFVSQEIHETSAKTLLDELKKVDSALSTLRS